MSRGVSLKSLAKQDRPRSWWEAVRRLASYLGSYRGQVAAGTLWLVAASASQAALPAVTGRIIDIAVAARAAGGDGRVVALPGAALIVITILGWYAQRKQILAYGTLGQKALFDVREEVFAKVLRLDVAFFEGVESGDLMSRLVNDIETISSFLTQGFRRLLGSSLGVVATLVGMLVVDRRLALATLVIVPVMLLVTQLFGSVARRAFRRRQETIGDVSSTLAEELAGIKVAQAYARTDVNRGAFEQRNAMNRDANITASAVSSAFTPTLAFIGATSTALVAGYGGVLAARGVVTLGVVVAFFNYARQFFNAITQLASFYSETQSALAGGERVFDLLDTPVEVADAEDAQDLGRVAGRVEFRGVSFAYGAGPVVIHDVDLAVEAGTTLAVVGPTGAGKTTLASLVARFYDPVAGAVFVDGHDLREVTMDSLRRNLGVVLQEPFLFSGTIADNIRYGRTEATEAEVRHAASLARALEFAERLPEGLDTVVGERGAGLSTGERQLVAFARAVLADPAVLILDEATSSVDTRTELLIQSALSDILEARTAIVIAHRLSTVRDADRIVVVEDGRIVEDGTYEGLLRLGGAFARLHAAQFAG